MCVHCEWIANQACVYTANELLTKRLGLKGKKNIWHPTLWYRFKNDLKVKVGTETETTVPTDSNWDKTSRARANCRRHQSARKKGYHLLEFYQRVLVCRRCGRLRWLTRWACQRCRNVSAFCRRVELIKGPTHNTVITSSGQAGGRGGDA